jgi:hypothetical protein
VISAGRRNPKSAIAQGKNNRNNFLSGRNHLSNTRERKATNRNKSILKNENPYACVLLRGLAGIRCR